MRDDPDFNISFVSLIEKHRCLFDFGCAEYNNRSIQERAWEKIAKEVSGSVLECKERWKNLRASFTRYLKSIKLSSGDGNRYKKPYYLAEYLHFLKPFTKSRKQSGKLQRVSLSSEPDTEEQAYDNEMESPEPASQFFRDGEQENETQRRNEDCIMNVGKWQEDVPADFGTPATKKMKRTISIEDVNRSAFEFYQSRKHSGPNEIEDPDLSFFKSVLPDIREMNAEQKRRFKIGILNLAQQILKENSGSSLTDTTRPSN